MQKNSERSIIFLILSISSVLLISDIYDDLSHGSSWEHILVELVIVTLCTVGVLVLAFRYFNSRNENVYIRSTLEKVNQDLENYKKETQKYSQGLRDKIYEQFLKWHLTQAETEIALLLLKGLSTKEIATIREASEKTVSQQMTSVYQKSHLNGRAEFSAFFLEDLLTPN